MKAGLVAGGVAAAVVAAAVVLVPRCYSKPVVGQGKCVIVFPDGGYLVANGSQVKDGELRGKCEMSSCRNP